MHWFPLYTKEWAASVGHMSAAQRGIYISLLVFQWDNGSVPDCMEQCARIAGAMQMQEGDWLIIRDKFKRSDEDGRLATPSWRASEARKLRRQKQLATTRGVLRQPVTSAQNHAHALRTQCRRNARAMREHCPRNAIQSQNQNQSQRESKPPLPPLLVTR